MSMRDFFQGIIVLGVAVIVFKTLRVLLVGSIIWVCEQVKKLYGVED